MSETPSYEMNEESPSKLKHALNFGAVLGLILLGLTLVTYLLEMYENKIFGYINYLIIIGGIIFGIKKFRDEVKGGFISYSGALGYGVMIVLFASIITSFGNFIYLSYVDNTFIEVALENAEIQMIENGTPDEQVDMAMSMTKKMLSPIGIFIFGILGLTLFGLIVSLIAAAFLKKDPDSFENS